MAKNAWKKGVAILSVIYVSRMLGMFMVFPVFSLYAKELVGANETLAGLALGVYGLTQAILQWPYGYLSDRFGRRPLIIIGLILFLIGTVIAACADSIFSMIAGRAVQGMGAISSVTLAFAADITPLQQRGKVIAIIGAAVGMAFVCALILGPMIAGIHGVGVRGLFWIIALFVLCSIIVSLWLPGKSASAAESGSYRHDAVWKAAFSVSMLHAVFTGAFVVLPHLIEQAGFSRLHQWWIYLPANLIAIACMRYRAQPHPRNFAFSFVILALAYALMVTGSGIWTLGIAVTIFFIGFYRLETGLPHWVANSADPEARGRAMGAYSTAQFFGSFIGAFASGVLWQLDGTAAVFIALFLASLLCGAVLLSWGKRDTLAGIH